MNEANPLVPATQEQLDAADDMLASLSAIAYASPQSKVKKKTRPQRKSRFFFRLSPSFAEETETKKKVFQPQPRVHVDAEVERRLKEYRKDIPAELEANIDLVREFFLREIAPITMAAGAGTSQAQEVVKRLIKSDLDGAQFERFERMTALAMNIKMARFICRMFGMTAKEATEILALMQPRQPQIIPVGVPNESRPQQRRETNKKDKNPS